MGDSTNFTVLPVWAQAKLSHGDGDTQALLPIVRWRNAFVDLQTLQSVVSSFGFMGHHTTDGFPQHTARSTEMEWTTSRVDITPFAQISEELYLVPEEMSRQLQILTADNHYLASVQNLLGNDGCQATKQMATTVYQNWLFRQARQWRSVEVSSDSLLVIRVAAPWNESDSCLSMSV